MSEEEPDSVELLIGETTFNMNRHNTSLFTFLGALATHDHIFLVHEQEETRAYGTYVWNYNEHYQALAEFIMEHDFPAHLNMLAVGQCDLDAYDNAIRLAAADIEEGWPEEWTL